MRIDLHTHSRCSDGTLSPTDLVSLAATREVQVLALTDHDTVAGCSEAQAACDRHGIRFVPGVELTCEWRGREIHVVGLGVQPEDAGLAATCGDVARRRIVRVQAIGDRLTRHGLDGAGLVRDVLAECATPTRMHVARQMLRRGMVADVGAAFDRWLGHGRPGAVRIEWPSLEATVSCIAAAGGVAVLAHAHRYALSAGVLRELCAQFREVGGAGLEVSLAGIGPGDADRLASLARRYALAASVGSDFHEPGFPWRPLGRFDKLPDGLTPLLEQLPRRMA
jgi:predicted metal-dependent phosphoesterase TrpH